MSAPAASRPQNLLLVVAASILVIAGFFSLVISSRSYVWSGKAADDPYNLVVRGFESGHAWLAKEAPPELARAQNPYAFGTYRPFLGPPWNVTDLSYYHGHLYAYFGVTPAIVLFWPIHAVTGRWLHQAIAVLIFCIVGYVASVCLGIAAWRRYFPQSPPWAAAAMALILGTVTTLPVFLARPGLFEVSIGCGFSFAMLALAALWISWHRPTGKSAWLAAASVAYGLAVGARPSLLFGAVILLLPAAASLRLAFLDRTPTPWRRYFLAAVVPISVIGAGLAAYNFCRFGDALQFGKVYQLSGNDVYGTRDFAPRFFWDNFRLYFLEPIRWHAGFPYVWEPRTPPLVPGHLPVEFFFGTLTNLPILLAACLPFFWIRGGNERVVRGIGAILALLFAVASVPICLYAGATSRYLLDFMPPLALLTAVGFLCLQGTGSPFSSGRNALRAAAAAAVVYSTAVICLLALALQSFYRVAEEGTSLLSSGRIGEAVIAYEAACRINPDFRGHADVALGSAMVAGGRVAEGTARLRSAAHESPELGAAHFNLGQTLLDQGLFREAAESFARAAVLDPHDGGAEANLGVALFRLGLVSQAIEHEKAALRIDPTLSDARRNLQALESLSGSPGRK